MKFATPESGRPDRSRAYRWSKSGTMTPVLIGAFGLILVLGSYEHFHGNLHRLRETVTVQQDTPAPPSGPGGQDPILLVRHTSESGNEPEFTSATLLPGRGFNLWQLTAYLPGRGETSLLLSPPMADTTNVLSGSGTDSNGSASTDFGGAFLAPWAAQLAGGPAPGTGILQTQWQGQRLSFPSTAPGSSLSTEGLLLSRGADSTQTAVLPDGQSAQALFHAGSFFGDWPSNTDLTVNVELSGHTLDMTITAKNVGTIEEPFGIGWHPYFAIPSGNRSNATLVIPSSNRAEPPDRHTGISSGNLLPVADTPYDFNKAGGTHLGNLALDETYVDLHTGVLADGPIAELRDPAANYGLRVIPLSGNVTNFRVIAPAAKPWVSIGPNMNMADPFGHEWDKLDTNGMVILRPGDSVQWKVRLEIFSLSHTLGSSYGQ